MNHSYDPNQVPQAQRREYGNEQSELSILLDSMREVSSRDFGRPGERHSPDLNYVSGVKAPIYGYPEVTLMAFSSGTGRDHATRDEARMYWGTDSDDTVGVKVIRDDAGTVQCTAVTRRVEKNDRDEYVTVEQPIASPMVAGAVIACADTILDKLRDLSKPEPSPYSIDE